MSNLLIQYVIWLCKFLNILLCKNDKLFLDVYSKLV